MLCPIFDSDIKNVQWIEGFRYISLVYSISSRCFGKTIDTHRPETLKVWKNEFINLGCLPESPYIIDVVSTTIAHNPYSSSKKYVSASHVERSYNKWRWLACQNECAGAS